MYSCIYVCLGLAAKTGALGVDLEKGEKILACIHRAAKKALDKLTKARLKSKIIEVEARVLGRSGLARIMSWATIGVKMTVKSIITYLVIGILAVALAGILIA